MGNLITDKYAILTGGAIVVDRGASTKADKTNKVGRIAAAQLKNTNQRYMSWGRDNCLPSNREALVADNNIVPALIMTRRNIILGRGLMAYREVLVDGEMTQEEVEMPTEVVDFLERSEFTKYLNTACRNEVFHSAIPTEYIRDRAGRVSRIRAFECRHVRLSEQEEDGRSRYLIWKGNWNRRTTGDLAAARPAQRVELYRAGRRQNKFATFEVDDLLCLDEYYPTPFWEGSEEWIELANLIPQFHKANLEHGYSMRWHIEIPKDYFLDARAYDATPDPDERKRLTDAATQAKRDFLTKLNQTLQGLKNAGKTIVTTYDINKSVGKEYPGIKITPLSYDMKDEALLKLFDASNAANMSAQGIHPTLANIQTQGKLSSGSEIRNAYLMYVAVHTPAARERLLRPLYLVARENGWPKDLKFGFRDMLITRLDEDKSGTNSSTENVAA